MHNLDATLNDQDTLGFLGNISPFDERALNEQISTVHNTTHAKLFPSFRPWNIIKPKKKSKNAGQKAQAALIKAGYDSPEETPSVSPMSIAIPMDTQEIEGTNREKAIQLLDAIIDQTSLENVQNDHNEAALAARRIVRRMKKQEAAQAAKEKPAPWNPNEALLNVRKNFYNASVKTTSAIGNFIGGTAQTIYKDKGSILTGFAAGAGLKFGLAALALTVPTVGLVVGGGIASGLARDFYKRKIKKEITETKTKPLDPNSGRLAKAQAYWSTMPRWAQVTITSGVGALVGNEIAGFILETSAAEIAGEKLKVAASTLNTKLTPALTSFKAAAAQITKDTRSYWGGVWKQQDFNGMLAKGQNALSSFGNKLVSGLEKIGPVAGFGLNESTQTIPPIVSSTISEAPKLPESMAEQLASGKSMQDIMATQMTSGTQENIVPKGTVLSKVPELIKQQLAAGHTINDIMANQIYTDYMPSTLDEPLVVTSDLMYPTANGESITGNSAFEQMATEHGADGELPTPEEQAIAQEERVPEPTPEPAYTPVDVPDIIAENFPGLTEDNFGYIPEDVREAALRAAQSGDAERIVRSSKEASFYLMNRSNGDKSAQAVGAKIVQNGFNIALNNELLINTDIGKKIAADMAWLDFTGAYGNPKSLHEAATNAILAGNDNKQAQSILKGVEQQRPGLTEKVKYLLFEEGLYDDIKDRSVQTFRMIRTKNLSSIFNFG